MDKQSLLHEAFRDFRDGKSDSALKKYQKALALEPQDIHVLNMLGDVSFRQGLIVEAIGYFKDAVLALGNKKSDNKVELLKKKMIRLDPDSVDDLDPEPEKPDELKPDAEETVEKLKSAIASDPKNFENYQKLGDVLAKNNRPKEAAEQYLVIGNALYNGRMYKKAGTVFKKIISMDPHCLPARVALGEIYSKDGSDSDAKKEFLFVSGRLIRQGDLERGQLFAQKAIQLKSIEAHYYLGLMFVLNKQWEDASKEMETLLKFKVNHQSGLTQLARIRTEAKQYDEAAALYERLLKADAKNAYAHECLGALARAQNQPDLAGTEYSKAMDAYAANEDWELTAYCAHVAIELDQNNQELYLKLADASYNAGLETEAAEACLALADLLDAEGKSQEAEEMRGKAREIQGGEPVAAAAAPPPAKPAAAPAVKPAQAAATPDETQVMLNMADTYVQQGSLDEAIEIYQKILKRDPDNQTVKNSLTRVYAMFAGINPETAVSRKGAAPTAPKSAREEKDEQKVQREARERALREAQVRSQRSSAAETSPTKTAGKQDEMLQSIGNTRGDEIAGDNQDEFMTVTVAEIYTKQGLLNEALKIYQKILEIEPGNMEAQVKKQQLEKKMAEQEKLQQKAEQKEKAEPKAEKSQPAAEVKNAEVPGGKPKAEPPRGKGGKNDDDPPPAKGRRGRVSYV